MKPLRVAQIMGKWLGGGVESFVMNYYKHLDHSKIQFDFLCDADSTNIPYKEIEALGGKVIIIPPYQHAISYQKELKKALKKGDYKLVHSHINTLSVFSLLAAKRAGVPIRIAHSHSTTNKKEKKKHLLKIILRPLSKVFSTHYMSCSEHAGRWQFGNKAFSAGKVKLIHNAIELNKFKFNENIRNDIRRKLKIDNGTLVVGNIGRFVQTKNHSFLIDIFKEIHEQNSNSILIMVGQGPLMKEIQEKAKNMGLSDQVKFLGQIDNVNELYQAFDVFILPSLYEGLGMVLIEAEASGLKCITSLTVPKEVGLVKDHVIFKELTNPEAWAEEALKPYVREADLSKLETLYDIDKNAKELESYYLSLGSEINEKNNL